MKVNIARAARRLASQDSMGVGEAAGRLMAEGKDYASAALELKALLLELGQDSVESEKDFDNGFWSTRWPPDLAEESGMGRLDSDEVRTITAPWKRELGGVKAALSKLGIGFES